MGDYRAQIQPTQHRTSAPCVVQVAGLKFGEIEVHSILKKIELQSFQDSLRPSAQIIVLPLDITFSFSLQSLRGTTSRLYSRSFYVAEHLLLSNALEL